MTYSPRFILGTAFSLAIAISLPALAAEKAAETAANSKPATVTPEKNVTPEKAATPEKIEKQLKLAGKNRSELEAALAAVSGDERATLEFLLVTMPERDLTSLSKDFLVKNVQFACKARAEVPWGKQLPDEVFMNDVAPYASINERRDDWRKDFYDRFMPKVKKCRTAGEAALLLNREAFRQFNVRYHATLRHKPDQSPYESAEIHYASCTGLSVLAIDACRAVAVPARLVGTPLWTDNSGNHSWAEIWDGQWRFIGASESTKLDIGWFNAKAAKADPKRPECRIYATSFAPTGTSFPLIWDPSIRYVHACDVTSFYTTRRTVTFEVVDAAGKPAAAAVTLRLDGHIVAAGQGHSTYDFIIGGGQKYQAEWSLADGKSFGREVSLSKDESQLVRLVAKGK